VFHGKNESFISFSRSQPYSRLLQLLVPGTVFESIDDKGVESLSFTEAVRKLYQSKTRMVRFYNRSNLGSSSGASHTGGLRYKVVYPKGTFIRAQPTFESECTGEVLQFGEFADVLKAVEEGNITFYHLTDGSGWVMGQCNGTKILEFMRRSDHTAVRVQTKFDIEYPKEQPEMYFEEGGDSFDEDNDNDSDSDIEDWDEEERNRVSQEDFDVVIDVGQVNRPPPARAPELTRTGNVFTMMEDHQENENGENDNDKEEDGEKKKQCVIS
jgi:hypothetical protein